MPPPGPCSALASARALHQSGRLAEAEAACNAILKTNPADADALQLLGLILSQTGRAAKAIELITEATKLRPAEAAFHVNLGLVLASDGRFDEAVAACRQAVAANPKLPQARLGLANALQCAGNTKAAVAEYEQLLASGFDSPDARQNLGLALAAEGRYEQAVEHYRFVLARNPRMLAAMVNLGAALAALGDLYEAIAWLGRALAIDPKSAEAHDTLAAALKDAGDMPAAMRHFDAAAQLHPSPQIASHALNAMQYDASFGPEQIKSAHERWFERYVAPLQLKPLARHGVAHPDRKLRIGYLSPDFRRHAAAHHLFPLLRNHDRDGFEIYCYSNNPRDDDFTDEFRGLADGWRSIRQLTDERAAGLIHADRIDILVDAAMHMGGNRALLIARQPAPVQVAFIAYPGTTGIPTVQYRLTDPQLDPTPERDAPLYRAVGSPGALLLVLRPADQRRRPRSAAGAGAERDHIWLFK